MRIRIGKRSSARSSKLTLVWALIPAGLTVGLGYQAWDLYRTTGLSLETGVFAAGALFTAAMGLSVLRSRRTGRAREARLEAARNEFADEPWKIRPEWRDRRFRADPPGSRGMRFMAVVWNLLTWPLATVVIHSEFSNPSPDRAVFLVLLFPGIGLLLAAIAARGILQRRKFGSTEIELDALPVPLGGRLGGRVLTGIQPRDTPPEGFRVALNCYRRRVRRTSDGDGGTRREVDMDLLWRDETRMAGVPEDANTRLAVPFSFDLPEDQPESTAEKTENRILWRLDVHADLPGIDYETSIEIPVFDVGGVQSEASSNVAAAGADDPYARYELGSDLTEPRSRGIQMREPTPGRIEFFFDRARNKTTIIVPGIVALACLAVVVGTILSGRFAGILLTLILMLLGGVFGWVAWRAWSYTSRVAVDEDGVRVLRGPFGRGEPVVIPASEIVAVRPVVAGRSGSGARSTSSYRLELERIATDEDRVSHEAQLETLRSLTETLGFEASDGESVSDRIARSNTGPRPTIQLADGLSDKQEADWIALRIMEAAVGARPEHGG